MEPLAEKSQALEEIENSGPNGPSPDSIRKYLRLVRELKLRESESVARWGSALLSNHRRVLLEEELWLVHEQVALAAMDCQATTCAASCVNAICREFPNSSIRAKRLKGMYYEASANLSEAERIYDSILDEDPTNEMALKRKVAIQKNQGDLPGVVQSLCSYLDTFMLDKDAWEELAEVYLQMQHYKQAAFCYEELLLLAPGELTYHLLYADILYTMGGGNNIKTAFSYYCQAVESSHGKCARALFGICNCLSKLKASQKEKHEVGPLTSKALLKLYSQKCPNKLQVVKGMLEDQGLLD